MQASVEIAVQTPACRGYRSGLPCSLTVTQPIAAKRGQRGALLLEPDKRERLFSLSRLLGLASRRFFIASSIPGYKNPRSFFFYI